MSVPEAPNVNDPPALKRYWVKRYYIEGMKIKDIAARLGLGQSMIFYYLAQLAEEGEIVRRGHKRQRQWDPATRTYRDSKLPDRKPGEAPYRCFWCGKFRCYVRIWKCDECSKLYERLRVGMPAYNPRPGTNVEDDDE